MQKLTQEYLDQNPNLSGVFITSEDLSLPNLGPWSKGHIVFFKNGVVHREDGPAIITKTNFCITVRYVIDGQFHRNDDEPTIIRYLSKAVKLTKDFNIKIQPAYHEFQYPLLERFYHFHGKLHSVSHEAITNPGNSVVKEYYIHGNKLLQKEWKQHPLVIEEKLKNDLKNKVSQL